MWTVSPSARRLPAGTVIRGGSCHERQGCSPGSTIGATSVPSSSRVPSAVVTRTGQPARRSTLTSGISSKLTSSIQKLPVPPHQLPIYSRASSCSKLLKTRSTRCQSIVGCAGKVWNSNEVPVSSESTLASVSTGLRLSVFSQ